MMLQAVGLDAPVRGGGRGPGGTLRGWFVRVPAGRAARPRARARVAVAVALAGWLVILVAGIVGLSDARGPERGVVRMGTGSAHVVAAGETLWDVAEAVGAGADTRAVVDELMRLNDLDGPMLQPGQVLAVP